MAIFYALMALCLSGSALGQVPGRGACSQVEPQSKLNVSQFMGRWYEPIKFFNNFELETKCNIVDFRLYKNGIIKVDDSYISGFSGKPGAVQGEVQVADPEHPTKMLVKFPLKTPGDIGNCWVLGTDYDSYIIIYCCTNYDNLNLQYAWILTRDRIPDECVLSKAYEVIDKNNIDRSNFWEVEQASCKTPYA